MADIAWVTEHPGLDRYLEDTEIVDWQTPEVHQQAVALTRGLDGERAPIRALFEYVRDQIAHSFDVTPDDPRAGVVTCRASQVLRERTGICYAKCHLLAALARARGIPVAFGYQRLRRDPPGKGFALHGFVAVWLNDAERWAPLDPRGDREGVSTVCDLDEPSWAWVPDAAAGEQTYDRLFARPRRAVLDVLGRAPDLERLRRGLPDSI
ncbi:MAG: transglutaminase-like domain-containing protein [Myxococcota bacterium]